MNLRISRYAIVSLAFVGCDLVGPDANQIDGESMHERDGDDLVVEEPEPHFLGPNLGRSAGCPQFHCDTGGTSQMYNRLPRGAVEVLWDDAIPNSPGSQGCSSHGTTFACVYWGTPSGGTLQIYSTAGAGPPVRVGASDLVSQGGTVAIAPIIGPEGDVITADLRSVIRVRIDGTLVWQAAAPTGALSGSTNALGPALTSDNQVVVAYTNGTVASYHADSGRLFAEAAPVRDGVGGVYRSITPPVASGTRIYMAVRSGTAGGENTTRGALLAYDADREAGTLTVAWALPYGGPTGASPYVDPNTGVVLLHARSEAPNAPAAPTLLAIDDLGGSARVRWSAPLGGDLRVSPARDPRGGAWACPHGANELSRYGMASGLVDTLALARLFEDGAEFGIIGHLYTTVDASGPSLITTIANANEGRVIAIDLAAERLLWSVPVALTSASYTGALPLVRNGSVNNVLLVSPANGSPGVGVQLLGIR